MYDEKLEKIVDGPDTKRPKFNEYWDVLRSNDPAVLEKNIWMFNDKKFRLLDDKADVTCETSN